ncbi:putative glycosidase C21B10.07 [Mycena chlorophos]|uniref:Putative glycosidase C21B10.07 n=1 Tax=Mycena chlorophos TaxID=658473 RepID=A0A8H6WNJ3_MYCCL|nr:putative glycosidase C21B10.07 [Mycena chlorophos]
MRYLKLQVFIIRVLLWTWNILSASATTYQLTDYIVGESFFSEFAFQNIPDPTHGRVNYTDAATAIAQNLAYVTQQGSFVVRADSETPLTATGPGRNSVRLMSNKTVDTGVIMRVPPLISSTCQPVVGALFLPICETWPALWTVGPDWPNGGEIDILEGVNDNGPNQSTLHTSAGCTMPPPSPARPETGQLLLQLNLPGAVFMSSSTSLLTNCDVNAAYNAGCGVKSNDPLSYGPAMNANGGGWYAAEIHASYIQVWFWPRNATAVPPDVKAANASPGYGYLPTVDTAAWGIPTAFFPSATCPISSKFGPQNIIINLTFCGDWAGQAAVYSASGCPSTCVDFVNNNPTAFTEAYFEINSLRIFEDVNSLTW